jgi:hypothetical protein
MASSVQVRRFVTALLKTLVIGGLIVSPQTGYTRSASTAPSLDPPSGVVVRVSTEPQLQQAVRTLQSDTTILIAPGTYRLTSTLSVSGTFANVALRGETGNRDDVVLVGPGMGRASYGDVPYGVWTGGSVQGIEISNLTIRDVYNSAIVFASGTQQPHVYNVHLIDAGAQFIEARAEVGPAADKGIVEYSVFEYTTTGRDASTTGGVDVHGGASWAIRHNFFRNIVGPSWQMAAPAIAAWDGAHDTIAEGNSIVNCSIGIAFGLQDRSGTALQTGVARDNSALRTKSGGSVTQVNTRVASGSGSDHRGGVVRNNMISRTNAQSGGQGVLVADSPYTQVLNNTVFLSQTYGTPIEYQFAGSHDVFVVNNLLDGVVWARDGATGVEDQNSSGATANMFSDAASGDLHLLPTAVYAIDHGTTVPNVLDDWDGQPRPNGAAFDLGADEYSSIKASANNAKALSLKGRVTASGGGGLAGVTISLSGSQLQSTVTGPSGNYTFSTVASGADYTVTASSSGYSFTPNSLFYSHLTTSQTNGNFVAAAGGSSSAPPTIVLTSPSSGSTFTAPANIAVAASATAVGVQKIDFFSGSTLIGSSATGSISWTNVAAGNYSLTAVVTDTNGATARSAAISVSVAAAAGAQLVAPISVTLTSPSNASTFVAPANVTVGAAASAGAGIMKIDFFAGASLIATSSSATASVMWSNVQAGTYSVSAVATDLTGATASSAPVFLTVDSSGGAALPTATGDPTTWPLVQSSNLVYQGAFRLPSSSNNGAFDFGGAPMAFNAANNSLFVGNYYGQVAELNIPAPVNSALVSNLPFAGYIQGFADPTEGHLQSATNDPSNGASLSGLLVSGGNLYGTASVYYDANNTQTVSHYRHSLTLSTSSFSGFSAVWQPTSADVANGVPPLATGYASGYLAAVPSAWQSLLGGPAISGQWGLPIIMRESYGPDAIVWDPSQLGSRNGQSLLYYTNTHQTLGAWANASPMWGGTATNGGAVLVDGTRTALFFGRNGLGTFCYGEGTSNASLVGTINPTDNAEYCYDPTSSDKGQHAYPYVYQVWAYDLNDLAAVKNGSKQPWQVVPYATWTLNLPTNDATWKGLGGVGYDSTHQLVYVSQLRADPDGYADRAVIHVFKIQ